MRIIIALMALFMVAACAQKPAKPVVTTVYVKVKEPCISKAPTKPAYKFGKGEPPGDKDMAIILTDDFEAAEQYGNEWEAASTGCVIGKASR
jgi:hypothetical protein